MCEKNLQEKLVVINVIKNKISEEFNNFFNKVPWLSPTFWHSSSLTLARELDEEEDIAIKMDNIVWCLKIVLTP